MAILVCRPYGLARSRVRCRLGCLSQDVQPFKTPRADPTASALSFRPAGRLAFAAGGVAFACLLSVTPVHADIVIDGTENGLSFEEELALAGAAERGDTVSIRAIVIAAIVIKPGETTEIVKDVYRLAPDIAGEVIAAAADNLPDLSDRMLEAAKTITSPKEAAVSAPPGDVRQTPPPAPPKEEESPHGRWSGETVLGGSYRNALEKSLTANAEFSVEQEIDKWTNSLGIIFDYGRTNGDTHTHLFEAEGKSKRTLSEDYYGYGLLRYEDDRFDGFKYRITEGVGVGYAIFDDENLEWSVEGGPSLRQSRVDANDGWGNELLGRLASILDWHISDTASLSNTTSFLFTKDSIEITSRAYNRLRDKSETTNTTALNMDVIGNLGARLSYEIHYVSEPPEGAQKNESIARFALVHSF